MKKKHDMILLGIVLLVVLILFGAYCPMEEIIGIPCPGCNMLTALYWPVSYTHLDVYKRQHNDRAMVLYMSADFLKEIWLPNKNVEV